MDTSETNSIEFGLAESVSLAMSTSDIEETSSGFVSPSNTRIFSPTVVYSAPAVLEMSAPLRSQPASGATPTGNGGTVNGSGGASGQSVAEAGSEARVSAPAPPPPSRRQVLDLKARLYDKAQDSQALQAANPNLRRQKQGQPTILSPKPPATRPAQVQGGTFRTTYFKRDHINKQRKRQGSAKSQGRGESDLESVKSATAEKEEEAPSVDHHSLSQAGGDQASEGSHKSSPPLTPVSADPSPPTPLYRPPPTPVMLRGHGSNKGTRYDSTVPDNDSALFHLVRMRQKLRLVSELPHHGPGVKEAMEGIEDRLDFNEEEEEEENVERVEDDGEFLYALPRSRHDLRGRYNPYDLQVVSANEARSLSKSFFTLSPTSVTMAHDGSAEEEAELTPAMRWLYERRLFHMIFSKPVFVKFRIWKQFTVWKNNVRALKNTGSRTLLYKELFTANEILQHCFLYIRSECEDAFSSTAAGSGVRSAGRSSVSLVNLDKQTTFTLDQFCEAQAKQCGAAFKKLNRMRNKLVKICWDSCTKVAEMQGITHGLKPDTAIIKKSDDSSKGNKKGGPSYTEIAEWRAVLSKLSGFLRAADYIILNMLHGLVRQAVRQLLDLFDSSTKVGLVYQQQKDEEEAAAAAAARILSRGSSDEDSSDDEMVGGKRFEFKRGAMGKVVKDQADYAKEGKSQTIDEVEVQERRNAKEENKVLDADEVLREIREQEEVEVPPEAVFELQLVLDIPSLEAPKTALARGRGHRSGRASSRHRDHLKKSVSFLTPDKAESSHHHSGSEDEGSEDEDDEEEEEEEEREEEMEAEGKDLLSASSASYAYPDHERPDRHSDQRRHVSVNLSPSKEEFMSKMKGIISGFEHTIGQFGALQREPYLSAFWSSPRYEFKLSVDAEEEAERLSGQRPWPDIELLFSEDAEYQRLANSLLEKVSANLDNVQDYAQSFTRYCGMVDKARQVDVDDSIKKKEWSTEEFNHVLATYTDQVRAISSMKTERRMKMVKVWSQAFRESCLPLPTKVISAVNRHMPIIANRRNEELLKIIKSASKKLDHLPDVVEEFVEHLAFLGRMGSEMMSLEKEYTVVVRLYTIARDFDVPLPAEELALYQTLMPSFQHLKSLILYCEAKKDDNILKFSEHLNTHIESLRHILVDIKNKVRTPELLSADTMPMVATEKLKLLGDEVGAMATKARSYASYQERFGSSISRHTRMKAYSEEMLLSDKRESEMSSQEVLTDLSEIERDLQLRRLLWESSEEWAKLVEGWNATPFDKLNVDIVQKNVNKFTQTVFMLEKGLPPNEVVPQLKKIVLDFKEGMPVISSLRNPALRRRHWDEIQHLIGRHFVRDKNFTLGNLLELQLFQHKEKINDISTQASNEATLELMLSKVIDLWQKTDFRLIPHSTRREIYIIAGTDDIMAQLEESQVTIATIRGSRYVTPIKALVEEWDRKLNVFARTLDEWLTCQRNWLYLEQIFMNQDIQRQLQYEAKLFLQVDKSWKDIMRRTEDHPNALRSATAPGVLEILQSNNTNLEKIHSFLEDYLETKRLVFPRFYFLSNDDLLDILAQSNNPDSVQPHLVKFFGNIKSLEIRVDARLPTVRSMISAEGEVIRLLKNNLRARGPVEQWLTSVENSMFDTVKRCMKMARFDPRNTEMWAPDLKEKIKECHGKIGEDLEQWVLGHPGQVVLTMVQIMFNHDVLQSFASDNPGAGLRSTRDKLVHHLNVLAGMITKQLFSHQRMSVEALMTIDVHARDILNELLENKVYKQEDFEWKRQLRYEWDEQHNTCVVLQSDYVMQYGYEYLGCSARLVMTPLTDRCYLTLTGAMHLHLGGSPAGPAGTGKTETVKDLAKAVGKQCLVFNCSEGIDYKMMGKFFSGLSQSGSWCCFDEFNRIDVEVLSVIAQQLHSIKTAKDTNALRFMFEGRDIRLNATCGVFITMNPSYAGRVELPDNLKSLFRPVSMMVPDYALIAEIMLFAEGFTSAKSLAPKIVNLYQLSSKQLSQQDHYDFGMRAIKSVLVMAGQRKRMAVAQALQEQNSESGSVMNEALSAPAPIISKADEAYILIHALRDANLPKFLAEDVPLFTNILADLFPGVSPPDRDHGHLEKSISMAVHDMGLQHWPNQMEKVKQLHSQLLVRHGVMLVGPSGGGKSTVWRLLQRALILLPSVQVDSLLLPEGRRAIITNLQKQGKKGHVEVFNLNPKCVKLGELYGQTNPNTLEWTDGLLAMAIRRFAKAAPDTAATAAVTSATDHPDRSSSSQSPTSTLAGTTLTSGSLSEQPEGLAGPEEQASHAAHSNEAPHHWHWLLLDGPVDTIWVENLNTVLDDSKLLCLANGERISLTAGMRLIFEVDNLSQASPATISRCAMVYMDPVDLGWKPYIKTWISRLSKEIPESGKTQLSDLFDKSVEQGLEFIRAYSKYQHVPVPELSVVASLCHLITAFLDFLGKHGGYGHPDEELCPSSSDGRGSSQSGKQGSWKKKEKQDKEKRDRHKLLQHKAKDRNAREWFLQKNPDQFLTLLGKVFVFCYTWAFGGILKRDDDSDDDSGYSSAAPRTAGKSAEEIRVDINTEFDNFVREMFDVEPPLGIRMPSGSRSMFNYFVNMESGKFVSWDELVPSTKSMIEKGIGHGLLGGDHAAAMMASHGGKKASEEAELVPTVDTVRYSYLSSLLLVNKHPLLLVGDSGVGKTAIINSMLKRLCQENGTSIQNGTILGDVFYYSDRGANILSTITNLTAGILGDDGDTGIGMELQHGQGVAKKAAGGMASTMLQLNAQTKASRVQAQIQSKLMKKGRESLVGPRGKKVAVFIDDLNMPAPETYGAQPPLELLRQFIELGGFYDTKKLAWKNILDVLLIAACAPPGGGRNAISSRLLKHFSILALPQPATKSLQHIYQVQLGRFFENHDFLPDIKDLMLPLVSAAIAVYNKMCTHMLPTPAKSHYTFNLRDLSAIIQGLFQADESVMNSSDVAVQLFAHEATRVLHDRLVDDQDRKKFFAFLADDLHNFFKVRWTPSKLQDEPIMFGDYLNVNAPMSGRVYSPISDRKKLAAALEEYQIRLNFGNTQAKDLVFFKEAVEHITRAARVFRQPGRHMLLVGLDGTGKTSSVQLACHIAGCALYRLTLTRGYNHLDFREDLKSVFKQTGVQGITTVFLLTDSDIVKESFLEDINSILNSGEAPDLFDKDELEAIAMDLKKAATEAEIPDTREDVYQFFLKRVRLKLHVVLACSPAGTTFRHRCRMHPALINCCTIDWFHKWSDKAMLSVAQLYFNQLDFTGIENGQDPAKLKVNIAEVCVQVQKDVTEMSAKFYEEMRRRFYTTPASYLDLIRLYSNMLKENKQEFTDNRNRLVIGLSKLSEANSLVDNMQEELVNLGPKIEEKAKDTEMLLVQLSKDQEAVDEVRLIVEEEETVMIRETEIVQDYANQAQQDLNSVIPALQEAIAALDALDKSDIAEIRVYTNPPVLVMQVMAAVCTLLQQKPDWPTAKHILADPGFLKKLVTFDKNNLPEKIFGKLKKYTKMPGFEPEKVGQVSVACKSICQWVLALDHYVEVHKMVKPKQRRVDEAKEALKMAQDNLKEKQDSLAKIQDHLRVLQQQYNDSVAQRESLRERKVLTTLRLQRASVLITALANEEIRWRDSLEELEARLDGIVGDSLVSAAASNYLGAFNASYRRQVVDLWTDRCNQAGIPVSKNFTVISAMAKPNVVLKWHSEGLPPDDHSTENAIFVKQGHRWPLLIDPQQQATSWICSMEGSKLKRVDASDPNYMRTLERAIRVGEAVLLQEVTEELDPALNPILVKEIVHRGGQDLIKLGDTEIEYNENFRLYMTTSMPNPHYLPAVCIKVALVNFTVTFEGLQDQLLSTVMQQERPALEAQRRELLESIATDLTSLRELEDKSLSLLQKSEGHILLDDQDLVDTLQSSKRMSEEILHRISQTEVTHKKLEMARKKYLRVATRGAVLYFVIADLANVDVMYQFSLAWFRGMFRTSINYTDSTLSGRPSSGHRPLSGRIRPSSARSSPDLSQNASLNGKSGDPASTHSASPAPAPKMTEKEFVAHLTHMLDNLTENLYRVVSKALFADHQLVFTFLLTTSIMRCNATTEEGADCRLGQITDTQWKVFLQGPILASMMTPETEAKHDGLTPLQRLEVEAGIVHSDHSSRVNSAGSSGSRTPANQRAMAAGGSQSRPPRWISNVVWKQCQHLSATLAPFNRLCMYILQHPDQWNDLFALHPNPYQLMATTFIPEPLTEEESKIEKAVGPFPWEKLSPFQKLMLIKVLRPDALTIAVQHFLRELMGPQFISSGSFDLKAIFEESSAKHPLIFILSPGVDPTIPLMRFAKEMRGSTLHVDMISLGRGQGPKAEELISKAQILKGRWVFLQNCHLAASFMPRLQAIVEGFSKPNSDVDPQFRLWLSSKPDPCFPVTILQTCMKMTVEAPKGLKANLLRTFGSGGASSVTEELWEDADAGPAWKSLLFGLCFFNSLIHERKKYRRLGWNIPYEFSSSDLEVSLLMLKMLLSENVEVPWTALRYLTGEVAYGGRVTDSWDRRCLHSILNKFYSIRALNQDYNYSNDQVYHPMSASSSFSQCQAYIQSLPDFDSPQLFGMHPNAEKSYMESQAKELIDTISSVQPRLSSASAGGGKSSDEIVLEVALDVQRSLPTSVQPEFDEKKEEQKKKKQRAKGPSSRVASIHEMTFSGGYVINATKKGKSDAAAEPEVKEDIAEKPTSALTTFLHQEIDRFNRLLSVIHTTVKSLELAVEGEIVMSEMFEEMYLALLNHRVPKAWRDASYESCKLLGSWVDDLQQRVDFLSRWLELVESLEEKRGKDLGVLGELEGLDSMREQPRCFWLSAFFFPQGFLTAVLQNYARQEEVSIDSLAFNFNIYPSPFDSEETLANVKQHLDVKETAFKGPAPPSEGVLVFGLYLDGARFDPDSCMLQDSHMGQRFCRLPEIHFIPTKVNERLGTPSTMSSLGREDTSVFSGTVYYECPLYRTSARAGTLSSTGHSTNFVTSVSLPSEQMPDFWITRGVALLCQLDD